MRTENFHTLPPSHTAGYRLRLSVRVKCQCARKLFQCNRKAPPSWTATSLSIGLGSHAQPWGPDPNWGREMMSGGCQIILIEYTFIYLSFIYLFYFHQT